MPPWVDIRGRAIARISLLPLTSGPGRSAKTNTGISCGWRYYTPAISYFQRHAGATIARLLPHITYFAGFDSPRFSHFSLDTMQDDGWAAMLDAGSITPRAAATPADHDGWGGAGSATIAHQPRPPPPSCARGVKTPPLRLANHRRCPFRPASWRLGWAVDWRGDAFQASPTVEALRMCGFLLAASRR